MGCFHSPPAPTKVALPASWGILVKDAHVLPQVPVSRESQLNGNEKQNRSLTVGQDDQFVGGHELLGFVVDAGQRLRLPAVQREHVAAQTHLAYRGK